MDFLMENHTEDDQPSATPGIVVNLAFRVPSDHHEMEGSTSSLDSYLSALALDTVTVDANKNDPFNILSLKKCSFTLLPKFIDPNLGLLGKLEPLNISDCSDLNQPWNVSPKYLTVPHSPTFFGKNEDTILLIGGLDPIQPDDFVIGSSMFLYLCNAKSWQYCGTMPEPRSYHSAVLNGSSVYITGGYSAIERNHGEMLVTSTTYKLLLNEKIWKRCADMNIARSMHTMVAFKNRFYVFGGRNNTGKIIASVEMYDPIQDVWKEICCLPKPLMGHSSACTSNNIWIIGGITSSNEKHKCENFSSEVFIFDVTTFSWETSEPLPKPCAYSSAVFHNDDLWLIGGACSFTNEEDMLCSSNIVYHLNITLCPTKWHCQNALLLPRHAHSISSIGDDIFIFGGVNSETLSACNVVEKFNVQTLISNEIEPISYFTVTGCTMLFLPKILKRIKSKASTVKCLATHLTKHGHKSHIHASLKRFVAAKEEKQVCPSLEKLCSPVLHAVPHSQNLCEKITTHDEDKISEIENEICDQVKQEGIVEYYKALQKETERNEELLSENHESEICYRSDHPGSSPHKSYYNYEIPQPENVTRKYEKCAGVTDFSNLSQKYRSADNLNRFDYSILKQVRNNTSPAKDYKYFPGSSLPKSYYNYEIPQPENVTRKCEKCAVVTDFSNLSQKYRSADNLNHLDYSVLKQMRNNTSPVKDYRYFQTCIPECEHSLQRCPKDDYKNFQIYSFKNRNKDIESFVSKATNIPPNLKGINISFGQSSDVRLTDDGKCLFEFQSTPHSLASIRAQLQRGQDQNVDLKTGNSLNKRDAIYKPQSFQTVNIELRRNASLQSPEMPKIYRTALKIDLEPTRQINQLSSSSENKSENPQQSVSVIEKWKKYFADIPQTSELNQQVTWPPQYPYVKSYLDHKAVQEERTKQLNSYFIASKNKFDVSVPESDIDAVKHIPSFLKRHKSTSDIKMHQEDKIVRDETDKDSFQAESLLPNTQQNAQSSEEILRENQFEVSSVKIDKKSELQRKSKSDTIDNLAIGGTDYQTSFQMSIATVSPKEHKISLPFFVQSLQVAFAKQSLSFPTILTIGGIDLENPDDESVGKLMLLFHPLKKDWKYAGSMPEARIYHSAAVFHDSIYVTGGYISQKMKSSSMTHEVISYNLKERRWHKKSNMMHSRAYHATVVVGDYMYSIGGRDSSGRLQSTMESYDERKDSWNECTPMPYPLMGSAITVIDDHIYVFGGISYNDQDEEIVINKVLIYSPNLNCWETDLDLEYPIAYSGAFYLRSTNSIMFFGGLRIIDGELKSTKDICELNISLQTWSKVCELSVARHSAITVTIGTCIYVIGGYSTDSSRGSVDTNDLILPTERKVIPQASFPSKLAGVAGVRLPPITPKVYGQESTDAILKFTAQTKDY